MRRPEAPLTRKQRKLRKKLKRKNNQRRMRIPLTKKHDSAKFNFWTGV